MKLSFRLRTFLVSTAMVAGALAVIITAGWMRVMDFEVERLDARLCSEARRLVIEKFPPEHLRRLEVDVMGKLRLEQPEQLWLRFSGGSSGVAYQSSGLERDIRLAALPWTDAPDDARPKPERGGAEPRGASARVWCRLAGFDHQGQHWRIALALEGETAGSVAVNLQAPEADIRNALRSALFLEVPLALTLAALGGWLLSAVTLRPINRLREAMKSMAPAKLDERLSEQGEDQEFAELIRAYNAMLARLERSFQQASRFSADAAHELKTPLTVLRGRIEQARRKATHDDLRADLSELLDEVGRLSDITRKLLLLAHADAGRLDLHLEPVDLSALLHDLTSDVAMLLDDHVLRFDIEPQLNVRCDLVLLRQLLNNLLGNCVRYSVAQGHLTVSAQRVGAQVVVTLSNTCQALGPTERARLFERFYRGDPAHNRSTEGHGLGLSLALEIARAHGGELTLVPSADTEFQLRLTLPAE